MEKNRTIQQRLDILDACKLNIIPRRQARTITSLSADDGFVRRLTRNAPKQLIRGS